MSGFALIFNRHREPVSPETLGAVLSRLAHRGPDGSHTVLAENIGLGCQHFWVTPEDVGVQQPLADRSGRYQILFDGRLDNRAEVLSALGPDGTWNKTSSDAELVLCSYLRWGDACFEQLLGPMAAAIVDHTEQQVVLARDAIGSRTLFYYLDPSVLVVASEPYAVLAHPAVSQDLNETTIARWYAVMAPSMGSTFFTDVSEMFPAHAMTVGVDKTRQWRYWDIDPEKRLRYRRDEEYAEHFLQLLRECVHCRLRATTPIGISMSGGYDSTSVAALAALELAARPKPERLLTFSWIFDELTECDERPAIEVMNQHFNMIPTYIPGDDAWPLRDWETWPHDPNMPEGNAYRLLKERLYQAVANSGVRVLLTGWFGGQILDSSVYWLAESLADVRLGRALSILTRHIRHRELRYPSTKSALFSVASRLLDTIPGARRIRPRRQTGPLPWLTPYGQSLIDKAHPASWLPSSMKTARPSHHQELLGPSSARGGSAAIRHNTCRKIELRHPHHDRRLIECALALPAYIMYDGHHNKHIVYQAMDGILPEPVRLKPSRGPLTSLYKRGLAEREQFTLDTILRNPSTLWQQYVGADALIEAIGQLPTATDGIKALLPWRCVSMETWHDRNKSGNITNENTISPSQVSL